MPEYVPAPAPVRPEWIDAAARAFCGMPQYYGDATLVDGEQVAERILPAVAPLIAAEAAAQERERIIEALKAQAGAGSTLAYEWLGCWDAVEFIKGLPAPGTEETT